MPPTVTLYSAHWCGYCRIAKRFLDEQQVPYIEINIDEDKEAAQRVEQWNHGNRTIPTLDINGTILTNPSPAQLRHVLGL
jgi:glutaredoxin